MDGVINVLKPPGMTSADVVAWLRRTLSFRKIGHTGTLDPEVAGVLPICLGQATRLAEYFTEQGKAYRAEMLFGITTDTQDIHGRVLSSEPQNLERERVLEMLPHFLGKISQVPPMYSAVRKDGKHLYEYARAGVAVEREAKNVEIYHIELVDWQEGEFPRALLDIECGKGTYIRTLCHDLGEKLGTGGTMSYLLRTRSGPFALDASWTLEEIETTVQKGGDAFLLPPAAGLGLSRVDLAAARAKAFCRGLPSSCQLVKGSEPRDGQAVQVFGGDECFLGIGIWREGAVYPHKVMAE